MKAPSPRQGALAAGLAYLAMTAIAFTTDFDPATLKNLGDKAGDLAAWPGDVTAGLFRLAAGLAVIALLDIVVALGAWVLFRADAPRLSVLMAATRIAYAVFFAYAIALLWTGWAATQSAAPDAAGIQAVLDAHAGFRAAWDFAFFFFALHLVLLGWLVWSDGVVRRIIAVLLVIAGLGYFADSVIAFALPQVAFRFGLYTFVGEMAVMIWLLVAAGRNEPARA